MPLDVTELLAPIPGDSPGGADIRYEPVFDQIKRARTEEDDLPTGDWSRDRKTADYALVVKLATETLSKKSKDLQVAAWLTEALLQRDGFAGLCAGLTLLHSMLEQFWDHLYPELEDGDAEFRASPLEWIGQYLDPPIRLIPINQAGHTILDYRDMRTVGYEEEADTSDKREARKAAIESGKLPPEDFDEAFASTPKAWYKALIADIDASLEALEALDGISEERFADVAPRFTPLKDAILEVRQVGATLLAKKLEIEPDPVEVEAPPEIGAVDATAAGAGAPAAMSATPQSRADAESRIAASARFLRAQRPTDPAPYLLLRGFRWGELRQAGPIDSKLLVAPPTDLRSRLKGMLLDGRWAELLENGEETMATAYGRGWLDLQRYILAACNGLGSEYDVVAAAIRSALQDVLRALPQLPTLTMMDDTPTANSETRAWLAELDLAAPDGPAEVTAGRTTFGSGRGAFERAMEKVRAGSPEQGIALLIEQANQERSARERFLRKSQATAIMVDAGLEAVALPILEELVKEIEEHTLEGWESGETVAQPLGLLYRCMLKLQGDSSTAQQLYLRICRLDPLQAIKSTGQPRAE